MGTNDAKNQVTITIHEDEGQSTLMTGLNAGGSYRISNFQGSQGLTIKVHSINFASNPIYAEVEVSLDGCPAGSRTSACKACATNQDCVRGHTCVIGTCYSGTCSFDRSRCPGNFELNLRTDPWGSETTWQLINTCSGNVALQGGPYPGDSQFTVAQVVGQTPHKLVLLDSLGDGFSAPGQLIATVDGLEVARETGNFKFSEIFYFGSESCDNQMPVPAPTQPPVPAIIPTNNVGSWNPIFFEGFDSGRSSIFNRGSFARISSTRAYRGKHSVEIRQNRAGSTITTIPISVSGYRQLQIRFQYYTTLVDAGERFFLDYSSSGTSNFQTIRTFQMGNDFQNGRWVAASHTWDVSGTSTGSIRIRTSFSDSTERLTIDQITLQGQY